MPDYGLDIVVPFTGDPDPTLPWADDDDALLVPGSLFLIDPAHSSNPWAGVPGNNGAVPNIAWKRARDLIGSGDVNTLAMSFADLHQAADATYERTGKGGFHRIYSQTNNTAANRGSYFNFASPLQAYLLGNLGHSFYFSDWTFVTRLAGSGGITQMSLLSNSSSSNNYLAQLQDGGPFPSSGTAALGNDYAPAGAYPSPLGAHFRSVGAAGWTGTAPTSAAQVQGPIALAGSASLYASQGVNKSGSYILYRTYLEDLTVSGRTFAQVDALDKTLYTAAFAAGGRFNGDTYTAPSSFP